MYPWNLSGVHLDIHIVNVQEIPLDVLPEVSPKEYPGFFFYYLFRPLLGHSFRFFFLGKTYSRMYSFAFSSFFFKKFSYVYLQKVIQFFQLNRFFHNSEKKKFLTSAEFLSEISSRFLLIFQKL